MQSLKSPRECPVITDLHPPCLREHGAHLSDRESDGSDPVSSCRNYQCLSCSPFCRGAETIAPRCYQYFQKMGDKQNHKGTLKNSFQITMVVHACNPTGRQETCCEPEDSLSYVVTTILARAAYKDSVSKIKNKNKKNLQRFLAPPSKTFYAYVWGGV